MSKFWVGTGALFLTAILLLATQTGSFDFFDRNDEGINFSDLETECRLGSNAQTQVKLNGDRSLSFEGHYPENAINADLDYRYRVSDDQVRLNIRSSSVSDQTDFLNNCLASVKYKARTDSLNPGNYLVILEHNGNQIQRQVIQIK